MAHAVEFSVMHWAGSALSPDLEIPEVDAVGAWSVELRGYEIPADAVTAFAARTTRAERHATLLLEPGGATPIRGSLSILHQVRVATGDDALALLRDSAAAGLEVHGRGRCALPAGVVAKVSTTLPDGSVGAVAIERRGESARVFLQRRSGGVEHGVALLDAVMVADGAPLWIDLPGEGPRRVAFVVEMRRGDAEDAEHLAAVERCVEHIRARAASLSDSSRPWRDADSARTRRDVLLFGTASAASRRSALIALAGETAGIAHDLAVSGGRGAVEAWAERVRTAAESGGPEADLAWVAERTAVAVLADRLDRGVATDGERGLLLQRFGEAGRFAPDLARAAGALKDRDAFAAWVRAENARFLASSNPAARVRAFDWLEVHGLAPDGYDPLATREERRAALHPPKKAEAAPAKEVRR